MGLKGQKNDDADSQTKILITFVHQSTAFLK
jgi:hypothetical protein